MDVQQILINLATLSIGTFMALAGLYFFIKDDVKKYFNLKSIELNKENRAHLLPLRLQAHERLIIFIDRINPTNLFVRLHQPGLTVKELQSVILNEIRTEYQHNITQQLYLNPMAWYAVKQLKEDTISMINNAVQGLTPDANGIELSRTVLQHMATIEENPYDVTLALIKKDIHNLF